MTKKEIWIQPSEAKDGVKYQVRYTSGFVAPRPYTKAQIEENNNDPDEPRKIKEIAIFPW